MTTKIGEFYGFYPTQGSHVYHVDLVPLSRGDRLEVAVVKADGRVVPLHSVGVPFHHGDIKVHLKMSYRSHEPKEI